MVRSHLGELKPTDAMAVASQTIASMESRAAWRILPWIHSLDPIRGVAAIAVVVNHAAHAWRLADDASMPALFLNWLGTWGVTLFFVLSGFCIHLPQARSLALDNSFRVKWGRFAKRRARRLLPTHYASLILSAIVGLYIQTELITAPTAKSFLAHIFMLHVFSHGLFNSINAVYWSIALEIQFYLCYPIYLWSRRVLGSLETVGALGACALATYFISSVYLHDDARFVGQHLFVVYWWQWALGAWLADSYCSGRMKPWLRILSSRYSVIPWIAFSLLIGLKDPVLLGLHVSFWLLPLLSAGILGSLVMREAQRAGEAAPVPLLSYAGVFSYSIYLNHPVAFALLFAIPGWRLLPWAWGVPLTIGLALIFSWVFFLVIERHFISVKQKMAGLLVAPHRDFTQFGGITSDN